MHENLYESGADPGEVKWVKFHPPFSEPPSFFSFSYPSNIEIILDFSDIITKIHPPFQNPASALVNLFINIYRERLKSVFEVFGGIKVAGFEGTALHQSILFQFLKQSTTPFSFISC